MWSNDHPPHREGGRQRERGADKFGGGKRLGGDRWHSRSFFDQDGGMDMTPGEGHQPAGEKQVHKDFYNNFGDNVRCSGEGVEKGGLRDWWGEGGRGREVGRLR